jgi:HIV Tat-specific factor 1
VYFNKETNTWRLEQDDDSELEYDAAKGLWLPVVRTYPSHMLFESHSPTIPLTRQVDDDLIRRQQAAYSVAGVDEEVIHPFLTSIYKGVRSKG